MPLPCSAQRVPCRHGRLLLGFCHGKGTEHAGPRLLPGFCTPATLFCFGGGGESKCSPVLKIVLGKWETQVYDTLDPC